MSQNQAKTLPMHFKTMVQSDVPFRPQSGDSEIGPPRCDCQRHHFSVRVECE